MKKKVNKNKEELVFTLNFLSEEQPDNREKYQNLINDNYEVKTPIDSFPIHYLEKPKNEVVVERTTEVLQSPDLFISPILGTQSNHVIGQDDEVRNLKSYQSFMDQRKVKPLNKEELKKNFDLLDTEEYREILINGHKPSSKTIEEDYQEEALEEIADLTPTHSNYEYYEEEQDDDYQEIEEFDLDEEEDFYEADDEEIEEFDLEEPIIEEVEETPSIEDLLEESKPLNNDRPNKTKVEKVAPKRDVFVKPVKKQRKYVAPPLNLLKKNKDQNGNDNSWAKQRAEAINKVFQEFNYKAKVSGFVVGPAVTLFMIDIEPGTDVSKINSYTKTLTMRLKARSLRIQDPIPGLDCAGIEIPNEKRTFVNAGNLINNPKFLQSDKKLSFALGLNLSGEETYADIEKMPHGLVAGATGSGKSVCINTLIVSLIYKNTPDELRFVLIDPKMVELSIYNEIPHLAMPVVIDAKKAGAALRWVTEEMDRRFLVFTGVQARNIKAFNHIMQQQGGRIMPKIVVIIDELADLMVAAGAEIEDYIHRLGAKARAAGIHVILATQRPSTDVIKGTMKNNIPTRIAFKVTSPVDSTTIIDHGGAEKLLGTGDMLFCNEEGEERIQGAYLSEEEISDICHHLVEHNDVSYLVEATDLKEKVYTEDGADEDDEIFEDVARFAVRNQVGSSNRLMQVFNISFNRSNRLLLKMEKLGIVSQTIKGKPREVLVTEEELEQIFEENR